MRLGLGLQAAQDLRSPDARPLRPLGLLGQPVYADGQSRDEIRYRIPLGPALADAAALKATLYYQALPPYYLRERFQQASGPETQRLYTLMSSLDLSKTLQDGRLPLASSGMVPLPR